VDAVEPSELLERTRMVVDPEVDEDVREAGVALLRPDD
jgi:hypothetical protein